MMMTQLKKNTLKQILKENFNTPHQKNEHVIFKAYFGSNT